jgi:hypothetical protein
LGGRAPIALAIAGTAALSRSERYMSGRQAGGPIPS